MPDNKFTLIGFLIVISIIAILCSLLLPCFSNAKYMTQASRCRSSQRQLGVIFQMYGEDFKDNLPPFKEADSGCYWFSYCGSLYKGGYLRPKNRYYAAKILQCQSAKYILEKFVSNDAVEINGCYILNARYPFLNPEGGIDWNSDVLYQSINLKWIVHPSAFALPGDSGRNFFGTMTLSELGFVHLSKSMILHGDGHSGDYARGGCPAQSAKSRFWTGSRQALKNDLLTIISQRLGIRKQQLVFLREKELNSNGIIKEIQS